MMQGKLSGGSFLLRAACCHLLMLKGKESTGQSKGDTHSVNTSTDRAEGDAALPNWGEALGLCGQPDAAGALQGSPHGHSRPGSHAMAARMCRSTSGHGS